MRVISGASGISHNSIVSSENTPKKIFWFIPAGIAPLGTMMRMSDSEGALNSQPVLVNVASTFVTHFGNDEGR